MQQFSLNFCGGNYTPSTLPGMEPDHDGGSEGFTLVNEDSTGQLTTGNKHGEGDFFLERTVVQFILLWMMH